MKNRQTPLSGFPFSLIVLCGIKHSGKSTCAKILAERLHFDFKDSDTEIEHLFRRQCGEHSACRDIFRNKGEHFFRQLETRAVSGLGGKPTVLAAGGGLCDNSEAWNLLKNSGAFFVYLEEPEERLFKRILKGGLPPFLNSTDAPRLFHTLYLKRHAFYLSHADAVLPPEQAETTPEIRTAKIIGLLQSRTHEGGCL